MLAGVSITCFASSYLVALILEISRLVFRSGVRGAALLGFAGAGLFAHTVFLAHRALQSTGAPLSSQQDWYLLSAWVLVAGYLGLTCRQRKNVVGLFLLAARYSCRLKKRSWAALRIRKRTLPAGTLTVG